MPCYYTGSREGDLELDVLETKKALTTTTEMLCAVMRKLSHVGCELPDGTVDVMIARDVEGLTDWWTKHKEIDAIRKQTAEAAARREAQFDGGQSQSNVAPNTWKSYDATYEGMPTG